jgi:hypothetical protein
MTRHVMTGAELLDRIEAQQARSDRCTALSGVLAALAIEAALVGLLWLLLTVGLRVAG